MQIVESSSLRRQGAAMYRTSRLSFMPEYSAPPLTASGDEEFRPKFVGYRSDVVDHNPGRKSETAPSGPRLAISRYVHITARLEDGQFI